MTDLDAKVAPAIDPANKYVSIVEQCYQDHIPGSLASQAGSEVVAVIHAFVNDLKKRVQEA